MCIRLTLFLPSALSVKPVGTSDAFLFCAVIVEFEVIVMNWLDCFVAEVSLTRSATISQGYCADIFACLKVYRHRSYEEGSM